MIQTIKDTQKKGAVKPILFQVAPPTEVVVVVVVKVDPQSLEMVMFMESEKVVMNGVE